MCSEISWREEMGTLAFPLRVEAVRPVWGLGWPWRKLAAKEILAGSALVTRCSAEATAGRVLGSCQWRLILVNLKEVFGKVSGGMCN